MSDKDCVINPLTNRPIKKGGAIYNRLLKKGLLDNPKTDCIINEKTGRAVRAYGKVGKKIAKKTEKPQEKPQEKPTTPIKPKPKKVPVIKDKEDTPFVKEPTTVTGKYNLPNRVKFINKVKTLIKDIAQGGK